MSSAKFYDKLASIGEEAGNEIRSILNALGGKVCVAGYRINYEPFKFIPYTYYDVDGDGYGVALSVDMVEVCDSGDVEIHLSDGDDTYEVTWDLECMNALDVVYLLDELEQIKQIHDDNPNVEVITEFSLDY